MALSEYMNFTCSLTNGINILICTITIKDTIVFGILQSDLMKMNKEQKRQKVQWAPKIGLIFVHKTL